MGTLERREPGLVSFAFLWAFALLYHQVAYNAAGASIWDTLLIVSALTVMLLPGTPILVGILAVLHVATVYHHLPNVVNHWYFAGIISVSLSLACASAWWHTRRNDALPFDEALPSAFAPAARWSLLLLYFLSGFHKLNADFFDPAISCASMLYARLSDGFGVRPDPEGIGALVAGLTVLVELGLPVLLLVPRLRRIGFGVGVVFHLAMAAAGYPRFSAAGVALLTLFLPRGLLTMSPGFRVAVTTLLLPAVVFASRGGGVVFFRATVVLCLAMLVLTVSKPWTGPKPWPAAPRKLAGPAMLGPVLALLSGIVPYLGLGTDRAFSMYSNLRTEGNRSNHFLVPAAVQMYPYQKDLVQVLESSAPGLERLATRELVIPFAELRARLTEAVSGPDPRVSVTYRRGATRHEVPSAIRDTSLGLPVSALQLKFLRFRPIEVRGPRRCGV